MTKLKKSLYITLAFILIMTVMIILEKIRLSDVPLPEDDVELRFRGIWMLMAVAFATIASVCVFVASFLSLSFISFCKNYLK